MRLYTKKKFHAKSPVAARITYSVRGYEEHSRRRRGNARVFSSCAITSAPRLLRRALFTNFTRGSFAFDKLPGPVCTSNSRWVSFFPGGSRMSTALRQQWAAVGGSRRNRKHIRSPVHTRLFARIRPGYSACLIRTRTELPNAHARWEFKIEIAVMRSFSFIYLACKWPLHNQPTNGGVVPNVLSFIRPLQA